MASAGAPASLGVDVLGDICPCQACATAAPNVSPRNAPAASQCRSEASFASHCTSVPSAVSGMGTEPTEVTVRSKTDLLTSNRSSKILSLHDEALGTGFPIGPIVGTLDHLEEELRKWATNTHTGGGGHGIRRGGPMNQVKSRGRRYRFQCTKDKKRGDDVCKWECTFEETLDGWVLVNASFKHNHALLQTVAEVVLARGTSYIPEDLHPHGSFAANAGHSVSEVDHALRCEAERRGLPITWNPEHVRSRFQFRQVLDLNLTDLLSHLRKRETEKNCGFEMLCNEKAVATHIFVQFDDAVKDWSNWNVLLFDPTWGTHRSGMKLCCFTTITSAGQTVILAAALLMDETADSLLWSFKAFAQHFKKAPGVFFSDDAASIATAFATMHDNGLWAETSHFLCTFHLAKNFFKHIHPVIRDVDVWKRFNSWFWFFAKFSDERFDEQAEWTVFLESFDKHASGNSTGSARLWLENLYGRKEQWMAKYTWSFATFGIHSTQRAESIHAAIKRRRMRNLSAVELIGALLAYNVERREQRDVDELRRDLTNAASLMATPPFLKALQATLTPFAYEIVLAQFALAVKYKSQAADGDDLLDDLQVFTVHSTNDVSMVGSTPIVGEDGLVNSWQCRADFGLADVSRFSGLEQTWDDALQDRPEAAGHRTTLEHCSCQFPKVFGLPCRHILHIHIVQQCSEMCFHTDERWNVRTAAMEIQNIRDLRTMPPPKIQSSTRLGTHIPSYQDRRSLLLDDFLPLVNAAASNVDMYHCFLRCLPALQYALQHQTILPIPKGHSSASSAPERHDSDADDEDVDKVEEGEDHIRIRALLGANLQVESYQPGSSLFQRTVGIKYGVKVWYLATVITEYEEGSSEYEQGRTHRVLYSDKVEGDVSLTQDNEWDYQSSKHATRWNWLLLGDKALSNHDGKCVSEAKSHGKGRKRTTRAAPTYGPTSKKGSGKRRK